jgi:hypothetical protein
MMGDVISGSKEVVKRGYWYVKRFKLYYMYMHDDTIIKHLKQFMNRSKGKEAKET